MKKIRVAAAIFLLVVLGTVGLMGCSSAPVKEDVNANVPLGAPPLMPVGHEDRFDRLGAEGCYGCHGAGELADPILKEATSLPQDHYEGQDAASKTLSGPHKQCNTCHVQA